jgi:hypothetical protein
MTAQTGNASPEQYAYYIALARNYKIRAETARNAELATRYLRLSDKYQDLAQGLADLGLWGE